MRSIDDLPTPSLVVCQTALERNLSRMAERAREGGVNLRPHCKTHKSAEIAGLATRGFTGGITVSTLAEAEYFGEHGFTDITYAVGIVPQKLERVDAIQARGVTLGILTDNEVVARAIVKAAKDAPHPYVVWIEIDSGDHRCGITTDKQALLDIARLLHESAKVELAGVLTHAGHSYNASTTLEIQTIAADERNAVVRAADRLEAEGIPCPGRSVGSTPTATFATEFEGLTEIRPGVYKMCDLMMEGLGVCGYEDIAGTVLATVMSHQPEQGHIVTDAGAFALSKDTGREYKEHPYGKFGLVRHPERNEPYEDLQLVALSQEHSRIRRANGEEPFPFEAFPIGSRLRILPHHACETLRCYDRYYVVGDDEMVVAEWTNCHGW